MRASLLLILGAALLCAPALWAAQAKEAASGDLAGAAICATCHEEVARAFASNPHARLAQMHSGVTCESCHGAGKAHVEAGGDKTRIFSFSAAAAKEVDARCLSCHQGKHPNFERTAHAQANVSCVGCHSIHAGADKERLLKAAEPSLCYQCHAEVKTQFSMPFHHKVNEGLMQCSGCHDAHGSAEPRGLKSAAEQGAVCAKCHAATAGPFVHEHAAVKAEGCTACHLPHGGPNPHMLSRDNGNAVCQQCHSPSPNFSAGSKPASHAPSQVCTDCHTSIHGSNTSKLFFTSRQ